MSTTTDATNHGNVAHSDGAGVQVPDSSRDDRTRSFSPDDFPHITGREEEWRYAPMRKLAGLVVNEESDARLAVDETLPAPVTRAQITLEDARAMGIPAPEDRPAAIAATQSSGVVHYDIPANAELDAPVVIRLRGDDAKAIVHAHLLITAGANSRATVVIEHTGAAQYSELVSVIAADAAHLTVISLQLWDEETIHLGQHDALVGKDAEYKHIAVTLGGDVVRLNANVRYAGPGGDARLLGLYFADAGQHLEHRTYIDHNTPRGKSDVMYKGALQGKDAHTVWVGDVLIRPEALNINTYELNRNLVLTDGARADSVPNLEIETGDIEGAGHASSTGRFDEEHLFYLMSRGISEVVARRLVVRGFFNEVIQQIKLPEIEEKLLVAIEDELRKTML